MSRYTKDDIFRIVEEEDVEFIRMQFCDVFGSAKNIAITTSQLERALNNACTIDATGLPGFETGDESELYLYPDIDSFNIFPWRPQTGKVARFFCDLHTTERKPFQSDPRLILKRVLGEAAKQGFIFRVDPEIEFFLFHLDDNGMPTTMTHEYAGYMDVAPIDLGENVRRDIIQNLNQMNFEVTSSMHKKAPGQHEIDFKGGRADKTADMIMTYKQTVKTIAKKHGLYATFLPKPTEGVNGSGMHLKFQCIGANGTDLFRDDTDRLGLSAMAYQFIAGILKHIRPITLVTNPLVNSYKRMVPGYDAPVNVAWCGSGGNRSALVRILRGGKGNGGTRIILCNPDATCNPYLALALCIAAGLDGIAKEMVPPEETRENLFRKSARELRLENVEMLPLTLGEALRAYEGDLFVQKILGEKIYEQLLETKQEEWAGFRSCVSRWEIDKYLNQY